MHGLLLALLLGLPSFSSSFQPIPSSCICHLQPSSQCLKRRKDHSNSLSMRWSFSKGMGSSGSEGILGPQGEIYFMNNRKANLIAPKASLGEELTIPLFPRNLVLDPCAEEYLGVYEMRYRQLLNDVGDKRSFGHIFYSQENSKLALVGTLTKIKRIERIDDGGMYVAMMGVGTFYIKEITAEKPYLKARVQIFYDYWEDKELLDSLELKVFEEVRYSVKIMKILYPQNNYTMNEAVLRYRPIVSLPANQAPRLVSIEDEATEKERKSKFSFGAMGMLKVDPVTKLLLIQQPVIEKRHAILLKVLEESTAFLEGELKKKGMYNEKGLIELRESLKNDLSDIVSYKPSSWYPENFKDGDWKQGPLLFE